MIAQTIFYLLTLFLPTQLGRHFWPEWSQVLGLRIDYLSPTLYLTDILILLLFFSFLPSFIASFSTKKNLFLFFQRNRKLVFLIFGLLIFLLGGILRAENPPVGFYKLVKILEFSFLGIYVARTQKTFGQFQRIVALLAVGVFAESFIALGQFFKQGSIGGPLWWLGERTFSSATPGIAQAIIDGRLLLRPYGTFPHPNVLAGFLVVVLTLMLGASWGKGAGRLFKIITFALGLTALFLTFSRAGWVAGFLALLATFLIFYPRVLKRKTFWVLALGVMILIFALPIWNRLVSLKNIDFESFQKRQEFNQAAWEMIKNYPLTGVGLNNFLVRLPDFSSSVGQIRFFQPAHNFYLLIGAETGILGLAALLGFLIFTYNRAIRGFRKVREKERHKLYFPPTIGLSLILFLGLFDHYFYTLQQGQLLATLIFGLVFASFDKKQASA